MELLNCAAVRRGERDFGERSDRMPREIFAQRQSCVLREDAECHAVMSEGVFEREQRCSIRRGGERGEFPQAAPALAGLVFEEDASAAHSPRAMLGEFGLRAARLLARE